MSFVSVVAISSQYLPFDSAMQADIRFMNGLLAVAADPIHIVIRVMIAFFLLATLRILFDSLVSLWKGRRQRSKARRAS